MNIQAEKLELVKLILDTENPSVLKAIKDFFAKNKSTDFWDNLSQGQKDEIQEGIDEIENGETVDYNEFIKDYR